MTAFDEFERRLWAGRAAAYERSFAKLCAHTAPLLLDAVQAGPGVRLLDVGTGPGTVAGVAAARGATVTAVDAEPSMVELARHHVPTADVRQAILPDLPFPDGTFDAVVANFVINHVGDPRAAAAELRRVVRPGGRVAVTTWPHPPAPLQRLFVEVAEAAGVTRPASAPVVAEELNFRRSADGLAELLGGATLADVAAETVAWTLRVQVEDWWAGPAEGLGALGAIVTAQPPEVVAEMKAHYLRLSARYLGADGWLELPTEAALAVGTAPHAG